MQRHPGLANLPEKLASSQKVKRANSLHASSKRVDSTPDLHQAPSALQHYSS